MGFAEHLRGVNGDRDILMVPSCEDYRIEQQLLALRKRLAEDNLNPDERKEIEKIIRDIEERLKM
ncbi:MAG TPA: hypothetical protein VMV04_09050 [Thermodesulfobacteriota bacterium]|nr:hypothetical protein [Thermodesulfobacteriota bacterium]